MFWRSHIVFFSFFLFLESLQSVSPLSFGIAFSVRVPRLESEPVSNRFIFVGLFDSCADIPFVEWY